jgi:hypothetical protein
MMRPAAGGRHSLGSERRQGRPGRSARGFNFQACPSHVPAPKVLHDCRSIPRCQCPPRSLTPGRGGPCHDSNVLTLGLPRVFPAPPGGTTARASPTPGRPTGTATSTGTPATSRAATPRAPSAAPAPTTSLRAPRSTTRASGATASGARRASVHPGRRRAASLALHLPPTAQGGRALSQRSVSCRRCATTRSAA